MLLLAGSCSSGSVTSDKAFLDITPQHQSYQVVEEGSWFLDAVTDVSVIVTAMIALLDNTTKGINTLNGPKQPVHLDRQICRFAS